MSTLTPSMLYSVPNQYNPSSGKIRVYSGTVPATADVALTDQVLLAEFSYASQTGSTPITLGFSSGNQIVDVLATGVATFYRILNSPLATWSQGVVGMPGSGADMAMNNTSLTAGDSLSMDSAALLPVPAPAGTARYASAGRTAAAGASAKNVYSNRFTLKLFEGSNVLIEILTDATLATVTGGAADLTAKFPDDNLVTAAGTADRFEVWHGTSSTATAKMLEGTVGLPGSGADMILDSTDFGVGDNVKIDMFQFIWS